jgi:hypothetical protein
MITPDHINNSNVITEAIAAEDSDANHVVAPVTRKASSGTSRQGDRATGPGDIPVRTTPAADESSYAAAPATDGQLAADDEAVSRATQPTVRIEVEDGHVVASIAPLLTDAAADVLWRVIEKAMRREEAG